MTTSTPIRLLRTISVDLLKVVGNNIFPKWCFSGDLGW